jgi:hypothetical protein
MGHVLHHGPPGLLRTSEAARFLSLSVRTLEKYRSFGTGPKYRKLGGRVVYALEDLKAWSDQGVRSSTSDPGTRTVRPPKPANDAESNEQREDKAPPQRRISDSGK